MNSGKVSSREELVFVLNHAAELEHSLSCSYFFTALSLKNSIEEGLTGDTLSAVRRWKAVFNTIAVEEMMHLAVVNNLLVLIGAAPHFDRPNFPHDCAYFMPDLEIGLRPFNEETLRHFIALEQPEGGELSLAKPTQALTQVEGDLDNEIGPDPHRLESQGEIYTMVTEGLRNLVHRLGEENVFVGPPPRQAVRNFFEMNNWDVITDLASAERILQKVVEQGEGGRSDSFNSHHAKFDEVLREYLNFKNQDPSFEPARPLLPDPFTRTPPENQGKVNLITNEFAIQISDLYNEAYVVMLGLIARFFVTTDESEKEATALGDAAIEVMRGTLLPLGELLATLPAHSDESAVNAGPSFVVRTLHALPFKEASWHVLRERVGEVCDYTRSLADREPSAALDSTVASFSRVTRMLT